MTNEQTLRFAQDLLEQNCAGDGFEVELMDIHKLSEIKDALEHLGATVTVVEHQRIHISCPVGYTGTSKRVRYSRKT